MRFSVIVGALLALTACEKESAKLERQYEMADDIMDPGSKCRAARALADQYLKEENAKKYEQATITVYNDCR